MEERARTEEEMAGWEKGTACERMTRRRWLHVEKNASRKALQKPTGTSFVVLFYFTKSKIANYWRGAVFFGNVSGANQVSCANPCKPTKKSFKKF